MARLLAILALLMFAPAASAQSFNAQEQAEIRALVHDYLVRNPDVLREALDALEGRVSAERWREVKSDPRDFSLGPADAPIVIVEFFDYRCPYCHSALEWVSDIVRTRDDVRLVLKELPILSEASVEASRAAIASIPQGRYWAFHRELMAYRGDLTSAAIDQVARRSGVDVARMRRDMAKTEISEIIADNREQALGYEISGTPGFIINGELVPGFDRDALNARLRQVTREARERAQGRR